MDFLDLGHTFLFHFSERQEKTRSSEINNAEMQRTLFFCLPTRLMSLSVIETTKKANSILGRIMKEYNKEED